MGPAKRLKKQPMVDGSSGGPVKLQAEVVQAGAIIGIDKLSVYDLLHVFSFLNTSDKGSVAQVCRKWKVIVYNKSLWRALRFNEVYVNRTASMEIVAKSFVERGISKVTLCDGLQSPGGSPDSPEVNAITGRRRSLRLLSQQFCHFTHIMAQSICFLHLRISSLEGDTMLQRAFSVPMPNLSYLGFSFVRNVTKKTMETISKNCPGVERFAVLASRVNNDGVSHIVNNLRQLTILSLSDSRGMTTTGFEIISLNLASLYYLDLGSTRITDEGIAFLATLPNLSKLFMICCKGITPACIEILSNACTPLKVLELQHSSIAGDLALELVGRSRLTLKELHVGNKDSATTDAGINALLSHGHRHYEHLEIYEMSDISRDGMILLAKRLNNLRCLKIRGEDKTDYAKKAAATESS